MNYRHAFHAGNFADVIKHVVLALCLDRLNAKASPYRYIDTHAGIGSYDLWSAEAERSPEWRDGVERVWNAAPQAPAPVQVALAPWLAVIRKVNEGRLRQYPGSPRLAAELMRKADALRLCEMHPESADLLRETIGRDRRVKIEQRNGFDALAAYLPPPERRGIVLVDPPFEEGDAGRKLDFEWMLKAIDRATRRWPQGTYILWRPIKDTAQVRDFDSELATQLIGGAGIARDKLLVCDLWVREIGPGPLSGAGVVIVNPPFGVEGSLRTAVPWLCEIMSRGPGAGWRLDLPYGSGSSH